MSKHRGDVARPTQQQWPAVLDDRQIYALVFDMTPDAGFDEMTRADYSRFRDSGEVTPDWDQAWRGVKWRLRRVPLDKLKLSGLGFDRARAQDYGERDTEAPPIILGLCGNILDGQHRVFAKRQKGEKTILAYEPVVAEGATGPLRHMVGNLIDSTAFCGEFFVDMSETREKATDDASLVTCERCKKSALCAHWDHPNVLADFLLGKKWRKPLRYSRE